MDGINWNVIGNDVGLFLRSQYVPTPKIVQTINITSMKSLKSGEISSLFSCIPLTPPAILKFIKSAIK